jgi:hypothetical protein
VNEALPPLAADEAGTPPRPFGPVGRWLARACQAAAVLGTLVFVALVAMSIVSISGRKLFSAPVPGDVELLQLCAAFASSSFFAWCHLNHGDVKVDFFTERLPARSVHLLDALGSLLVAAFGRCWLFGIMLVLLVCVCPSASPCSGRRRRLRFLTGGTGLPLLNSLKNLAYARLSNYDLIVIPLFLLMGQFATHGGLSRRCSASSRLHRPLARRRGDGRGRRLRRLRRDLRFLAGHRRHHGPGGPARAEALRLFRRRWPPARWPPAARWAS